MNELQLEMLKKINFNNEAIAEVEKYLDSQECLCNQFSQLMIKKLVDMRVENDNLQLEIMEMAQHEEIRDELENIHEELDILIKKIFI